MNWYGVITNEGKKLLARQDKDNPLMITSATAGTGKVAEVALLAQTTLTDEKQTISIIQKKAENYSQIVTLRITSENLTEGYICNQIGLWAKIGEESPVLFALYQNYDGQSIPDYNNSPEFVWTFNAAIEVNNEAVINITADTKALVTKEELEVATKAAAKAQNTADNAKTSAGNAQKTANVAKTAADNAQRTADDTNMAIENLKSSISQTYATKDDVNAIPEPLYTHHQFGGEGNGNNTTIVLDFEPKLLKLYAGNGCLGALWADGNYYKTTYSNGSGGGFSLTSVEGNIVHINGYQHGDFYWEAWG